MLFPEIGLQIEDGLDVFLQDPPAILLYSEDAFPMLKILLNEAEEGEDPDFLNRTLSLLDALSALRTHEVDAFIEDAGSRK